MKSKEKTNKNQDDKKVSRRQATKKLLVGGGIAGATTLNANRWVKPVVDSTVLPAHAGASGNEEMVEEAS